MEDNFGSQVNALNNYLQNISAEDAQFPDTLEAKKIFAAINQALENMVSRLKEKYKLFYDCTLVQVGSSIEGLKIGTPNEFDYSIIVPKLSESMKLEHSLHNNSVNQAINTTFFPELPDVEEGEEDKIYFTMTGFEIMDDLVSKEILDKKEQDNIDQVSLLYSTALENGLGEDGWSDVLGPIISMPQRSNFEQIFKEIDRCVDECFGQCLSPELSLLPKGQTRKFRSLNKPAFTRKFLWNGREFKNFEIDVDIALIIPLRKTPLYYNFPLYLKATGESNLPTMIPLHDSHKEYIYLLQSYKSCSLTHGIEEAKMFERLPFDSLVHQCIRVCKKIRGLFMTHYFDVENECLCPVLKSYWIKTVTMHVFKKYLLGEQMYDPYDPKLQSSLLSKYVMKIFELLHKCLTGDNGKKSPFMSSFNVPFKNVLHSKPKIDDDDEEVSSLLDEDQIKILHRPNIVAADDINCVLNLLYRLRSNDADAACELLMLKNSNANTKSEIYKEGIRDKLGILLYQYFEIEKGKLPDSNTTPYYMEFIRKKLPSIEVVELENGKEDTIEYDYIVTDLPIRLVENGKILDLVPMFEKARGRVNYWSLEVARNMTSDYHRNDYNF